MEKVQSLVKDYLDEFVYNPVKGLIENDIYTQLNFPIILVLLKITSEEIIRTGISYDKYILNSLPEEKRILYQETLEEYIKTGNKESEVAEIFKEINSKNYLIFYIVREFNWALISVMSSSYISANIIMRSVFEFMINISTSNNEGVSARIDSISFLNLYEKKKLKKYWRKLNAWSHPYGHWEKNFCPIYISHKPLYHKTHCEQSIEYLIVLIDFLITIGLEKYEIKKSIFKDEFIYNPQIFKLEFLEKRLDRKK